MTGLKLVKRTFPFFVLGALAISLSSGSCKGTLAEEIDSIETVIPSPNDPKPDDDNDSPPSDKIVIRVGSAAGGNVEIDGKVLSIDANTIVEIESATYQTVTIKNITGTPEHPVIIRNHGAVIIKSMLQTNDIRHVEISGNNSPGIEYGFVFRDIPYRAVVMGGVMDAVTLKGISFENVANYCISPANYGNPSSSLDYIGTPTSRTNNFKILNCKFENTGPVVFGGELSKDKDKGLFKDLEIAHNIVQNSNAGSIFIFGNVENFNIHHNTLSNLNSTNNNHNGIFYMQGSGNFHHNKLVNYQGNAIRLWPFSRGSEPTTVEIHHNICYNTRKYGAFEIQAFERNIVPGKTTFVNAKVYNNTVGRMNTSHDWGGQILDLYNMRGGKLQYYNNLGFDLYSKEPISTMIHMGDSRIISGSNNVYKETWEDAVFDTSEFISKIDGVGAK